MAATWSQFEIEPGFWVKPSFQVKQRRTHKVPLGAAAIELLDQLLDDQEKMPHRARSRYVFPSEVYGKPLTQLRGAWKEISEKASVALWATSSDAQVAAVVADLTTIFKRRPTFAECQEIAIRRAISLPDALSKARLYDLRHTFASVGAGGGLSLQIIGKLLGHSQTRTTQRYAHLADDLLREAAAKITAQIVNSDFTGNLGAPKSRLRLR
jgi:integrase